MQRSGRRWRRTIRAAVGAAAVTLLLTTAPAARADARTFTDIGQVVSSLEVNQGYHINRDCGFTAQPQVNYIGVLWVFCDSYIPETNQFIGGTSAGTGQPAVAPAQSLLGDRADASGTKLAQFIPTPGGFSCANGYVATWARGAISIPTSPANTKIIVPYVVHCVTKTTSTALAYRTVDYDTVTGTFSNDAPYGGGTGIFSGSPLAWTRQLGSPVVYNGDLYFYAFNCSSQVLGACTAGQAQVAWVPLGPNPLSAYNKSDPNSGHRWLDPANYTFSTLPVGTGSAWKPDSIDVHRYPAFSGSPFVAIEQNDIAGGVTVWSATSPAGPFTRRFTTNVPCTYPTPDSKDLCRAYIGHPESSTSTKLLLSYYQPNDNGGRGHLRTGWVPWN